jgi:DNA-binding NarL/FixJ family response regulator
MTSETAGTTGGSEAVAAADAPCALVVDGDEFFRIAFAAVLEKRLGFGRVIEATRVDEALAIAASEPDLRLVLVDLACTIPPGPAALGALRDARPDLVVAVMANTVDREQVLATLAAGLHGYVCKGEGLPAVTAALTAMLAGSIHVPAGMAKRDPAPHDTDATPPARGALTHRQLDVLRLLVEGRSNKEIARILGLGEGTVKTHVAALLRVLKVQNRSAAAVTGQRILSAA